MMKRKVLSLTAIFLFALSATTFAQLNIGYMDTQQVLSQLPERKQVQDEMNTFIKKEQDELTKRSTSYQDAIAEYQSNKSTMTQKQIKTREDELGAMQNSLDEFNQTIRQEVQQKRQNLLSPIFTRIDNAISVVAKNKNLDFVLNKTTNSGEKLIFYASANQTNITPLVVKQLKSTSKN